MQYRDDRITESVVRMTDMINMLYSTGMIGCVAKETSHWDKRSIGIGKEIRCRNDRGEMAKETSIKNNKKHCKRNKH